MRRTQLRPIGAVSLSLLMVLTTFFLNTRLALATDPIRGVEVKVDTSALDASVDAAKQAGVDVQKDGDVDKGTADSEAELNAKRDEIKADYDKQVQDLNAAAEDAKKQLGEYAAKKQKYDEDIVQFDNLSGTIVGFRTPIYEQGISVPGCHAHFIDDDRTHGGHVVDFKLKSAQVEICPGTGLQLHLPLTAEFSSANLSPEDLADQISKAEKH